MLFLWLSFLLNICFVATFWINFSLLFLCCFFPAAASFCAPLPAGGQQHVHRALPLSLSSFIPPRFPPLRTAGSGALLQLQSNSAFATGQ